MKQRQETLDAWVGEKRIHTDRRMGNTDSDTESGQMCIENASTSDLSNVHSKSDSEPTQLDYEDCLGEGAETSTSSDYVSVRGTCTTICTEDRRAYQPTILSLLVSKGRKICHHGMRNFNGAHYVEVTFSHH